MIPAISSGGRMYGLVSYLAGPGKANEHTNQHVVAASSREVFYAGGGGQSVAEQDVHALAESLEESRVVFGTEVTRRDKKRLAAAQARGVRGGAAIAEARVDENVWHCSLSLPPEAGQLDDAQWSSIAHEFMEEVGFDDPTQAPARWVAIRHGVTKNGGDHVHIAASRVRDDGSVVALWRPHPDRAGRSEGDYARAQRACRSLEAKHGLEVLSGASKDVPTRGTHHAQQSHSAAAARREAPSVELARRVRSAATAAESEAEFVRLSRADGLVIRPAHYDRSDPDAVTGFSVGLPASVYSNRHGQPVMHGGKKLGEDLSLPRLRERWLADENAQRDARDAWAHASRSVPTAAASTTTPRSESGGLDTAAIDARLRTLLRPLARSAASEADYVRAVRAHQDVLIRPRFARGSTTQVTGYSVALRPSLAAHTSGDPVWRSAGYLHEELKLSTLRQRWPSGAQHEQLAAAAWRRPATEPSGPTQSSTRARSAAASADKWQQRVESVTDQNSRAWHSAAADTSAAVATAARGMSTDDARELNRLADALARSAGHRRSTRAAGSRSGSSVARVTATMIAATREDSTMLWLVVAKQVLAASRAIGEAMAAQGHVRQARQIRAATASVEHQFADRAPAAAPASRTTTRAAATAAPSAPRRGGRPSTGRPDGRVGRREGFEM